MNKFEINIDELHESMYSELEEIIGSCHTGKIIGYYKKVDAAKAIAMAMMPLIESHLKPVQ